MIQSLSQPKEESSSLLTIRSGVYIPVDAITTGIGLPSRLRPLGTNESLNIPEGTTSREEGVVFRVESIATSIRVNTSLVGVSVSCAGYGERERF